MNRYYKLTTLLLVLALVSCYKDEPMTEPGQQGAAPLKRCLRNGDDVKMIVDPQRLHRITPQRAEIIAVNAAYLFHENENTRSAPALAVASVTPVTAALNLSASNVAQSSSATRPAVSASDTLMYAVNFAGDNGFALVSFDDRDGDILMYSENGSFDIDEIAASNDIMKFHVDMVMAYQQDKLSRIRKAEAEGMEYVGELQMDTVSVEEFDMPTDLAGNPYGQATTRAGAPGMPGRTCVAEDFEISGWEGNERVIDIIEGKYGTSPRCFGLPVEAPYIPFNPNGVPGCPDPDEPYECPYPPYCNPEIIDYDGYYQYYGATLKTAYSKNNFIREKQAGPYIFTLWSEEAPLNLYSFKNELTTHRNITLKGVPLAMAVLMVYNQYPTGYMSNYPYVDNTVSTFILDMQKLKTFPNNKSLTGTPYATQIAVFLKDISTTVNGYRGTSTGGAYKEVFLAIRKGFMDFGYVTGYDDTEHNYQGNFRKIAGSLDAEHPVLIYGIYKTPYASINQEGFAWLIDGYQTKSRRDDTIDYRFDEYGNYNSSQETHVNTVKYMIHASMGLGSQRQYSFWVDNGVYVFMEQEYINLKIVAGIAPRK